jgi:hypothetical protein
MLKVLTDACAENRLPDLTCSSMFEMYAQNGFIGFMYMLGMFCWIFETVLSGYVNAHQLHRPLVPFVAQSTERTLELSCGAHAF